MAKPGIKEQIEKLALVTGSDQKLAPSLNLHKALLEVLRPLDESEGRGTKAVDWSGFSTIIEKSLTEKRHLSLYLDPSLFDLEVFTGTLLKLTDVLPSLLPSKDQIRRLSEAMKTGELEVAEALQAMISEDASWLQEKGQELGVDPSLFLAVLELPLKPFFEELSRRFEDVYIEDWWEPHCPICGRKPPVGRMMSKKLYLVCSYCGDKYAVDLFQCINCGNKDPTKLGFISPDSHPELELHYCEVCKSYVKVINEELSRSIPMGLEDLMTRGLDELAQLPELGLAR